MGRKIGREGERERIVSRLFRFARLTSFGHHAAITTFYRSTYLLLPSSFLAPSRTRQHTAPVRVDLLEVVRPDLELVEDGEELGVQQLVALRACEPPIRARKSISGDEAPEEERTDASKRNESENKLTSGDR